MTDRSLIYLDNNATTRPYPEVVELMAQQFRETYGNPGSRHAAGRPPRIVLEEARESTAAVLGAKPSEIVFTSGGTEATNLAVFGLTGATPGSAAVGTRRTIALTAGEHPATMEACRHLEQSGWSLVTLDVDEEGRLREDRFDRLPWDRLRLVTVILAHNETGVVQGVAALSERCRREGVPLHLDAVQAVGKIPVHFGELGATTLALGAHKFHGPRGVGALLVRDGVKLAPWLFGGHQESGRRPGTEPVALIAGMAQALQLWEANRRDRTPRIRALRDRLEAALSQCCPPVVLNGSREH
ncbi:MAG: cysteine desulfurase, partial [Planctomycetes bacterium]|nr:cysteine desulfurase [Planctomycetota bacterium]